MKYKVVEMLNCMTGGNIDKFTDNEKLIPILEKHKYPLSRIKDILQSHNYTPEWKIRELKELFNLCHVCFGGILFLTQPECCFVNGNATVHHLGLRRNVDRYGKGELGCHRVDHGVREARKSRDRIVPELYPSYA